MHTECSHRQQAMSEYQMICSNQWWTYTNELGLFTYTLDLELSWGFSIKEDHVAYFSDVLVAFCMCYMLSGNWAPFWLREAWASVCENLSFTHELTNSMRSFLKSTHHQLTFIVKQVWRVAVRLTSRELLMSSMRSARMYTHSNTCSATKHGTTTAAWSIIIHIGELAISRFCVICFWDSCKSRANWLMQHNRKHGRKHNSRILW